MNEPKDEGSNSAKDRAQQFHALDKELSRNHGEGYARVLILLFIFFCVLAYAIPQFGKPVQDWLTTLLVLVGLLVLAAKLIFGQFNAAMDVTISCERKPDLVNSHEHLLGVTVRLQRKDIGRLEIEDVLLRKGDPLAGKYEDVARQPWVHEDKVLQITAGAATIQGDSDRRGCALPPGDGTQFAYCIKVPASEPVLVDVTILARRTGIWPGRPQWRASAISLPVKDAA
jgi:hypothetical protein